MFYEQQKIRFRSFYLVLCILLKEAKMFINKISSPEFSGAYVVTGRGKDVKAVKEEIIKAKQDRLPGKVKIDDVGYGYLEDDILSYLIVTTGSRDIKIYNEFAKDIDEYRRIADLEYPDDCRPEDFDGEAEYIDHFVRHQGALDIEMIDRYCSFSSELKALGASSILKSIKNGTFDFINGEIKNQ